MLQYNLALSVEVQPVWYREPPEIRVGLADQEHFHGHLEQPKTFSIGASMPRGTVRFWLEFLNKKHDDTDLERGLDKAVKIMSICLNQISSPRFVWQGMYVPDHTKQHLMYHDYLGWNGIWFLDLDLPVFSWIHRVENLGITYE